jgi:hypothetical protein
MRKKLEMKNSIYNHRKLYLTILITLIWNFNTYSQDLSAQRLYDRYRGYQGLAQWACEDSAQVIDYLLRLDLQMGAITKKLYDPDARNIFWRLDMRNLLIEHTGIEFQISILGCLKGDTVAIVAYPEGKSIYKQEKEMKIEYPQEKNEEIAKRIKMVYDTIVVSGNQELLTRLSNLKNKRSPFLLDWSMSIVPDYQIYSRNFSGQEYLFLSRESVEGDDQGKQLLDWIDETFLILKRISDKKRGDSAGLK